MTDEKCPDCGLPIILDDSGNVGMHAHDTQRTGWSISEISQTRTCLTVQRDRLQAIVDNMYTELRRIVDWPYGTGTPTLETAQAIAREAAEAARAK